MSVVEVPHEDMIKVNNLTHLPIWQRLVIQYLIGKIIQTNRLYVVEMKTDNILSKMYYRFSAMVFTM